MHPERPAGTPRSPRPPSGSRRRTPLILALLVVALLAAACGQTPTPTPTLAPAATVQPTPPSTPLPTPTALPTPNPLDADLLDHRFTVLVVGEDVSAARRARGYIGDNTDAMMVVSVSPRQKQVAMVSLPRDTVNIPLPTGQLWTGKVNAIANSYGIDVLRQAIADLLHIKIKYYVKVNMDDFVNLVDAVGGISVNVKTFVYEPRWGLNYAPGRVHLDGITALHFARARHYDSDYARAARQQQVIHALALKYTNRKTHINVLRVFRTLASLETNLPMHELPTLIALARRAARTEYVTQVLMPPQFALAWGDQGDGRGWVMIPNVDAMRKQVRQMFGD
ncbi:MAG TPA: LCP family protein [Candidatus Limnocylindria bacterium]|jgi:LCP family protein required for cell wall assembly